MRKAAPYLLFFASGFGGLVDQVIWVRQFGKLFGNTLHSSALVTAVFMCGLGAGSYFIGRRSDARHERDHAAALRTYGYAELVIAVLVLLLALVLPASTTFSAKMSSYARAEDGFFELSMASRAMQYAMAIVALGPVTFLMGGTLTLLIRFVVRADLDSAGYRVGLLYGANTAGAALGALATDFVLVERFGITSTQVIAAAASALAGGGALLLVRGAQAPRIDLEASAPLEGSAKTRSLAPIALALLLTGLSALGLEMLWFRFLSGVLGQFRAVFSILLAIVLVGIWLGSFAGGYAHRRFGRPATLLLVTQALVVVLAAAVLGTFDKGRLVDSYLDTIREAYAGAPPLARARMSLWIVLRPTLFLTAAPAFFMGASFPLANAIVQRERSEVGARAGTLYLANTAGNVVGSLLVGFVLFPVLGLQRTALALFVAGAASLPLIYLSARREDRDRTSRLAGLLSGASCAVAIVGFALLPAKALLQPFLPESDEGGTLRVVDVREGRSETIAVTEIRGIERRLLTNGFSMSTTNPRSQRYMRAFAHVPLLSMDKPERVLVICFGVGNTLHAASLHPTVSRLELADISRDILELGHDFAADNHDILHDPRVSVFVNDGRHHLAMQPEGTYDLITLEPPPIGFAGVASLYSKPFYELARSRLRKGGYMTQWLPGYQVGGEMVLSLVRSFLEVFPQSVLLSGEGRELILMGTTGDSIGTDVEPVLARLRARPLVLADLGRVHMGALTELFGTFVASRKTMQAATEGVPAMTDDKPILEYNHIAGMRATRLPPALFDTTGASAWCTNCFGAGGPHASVKRLPEYLRIMGIIYRSEEFLRSGAQQQQTGGVRVPNDEDTNRVIEKSPYLASLFGEDQALQMARAHLAREELDDAVGALERSMFLHPTSRACTELGQAYARQGHLDRAARQLDLAVQLDPKRAETRFAFGSLLERLGMIDPAIAQLTEATHLAPKSANAYYALARLLATKGDDEGSEREIARALDAEPAHGPANLHLCVRYAKTDLSRARPHCAAAKTAGLKLPADVSAALDR